ncbi:2-hydroxymuconate tautomerase [Desulfuribacillus alkaliarsenatis]|uniref:Tautomerase n=1 Tax=Desulfuribacillus alkaliarsenatis TaxID=766136 RepID=A0A1E5G4W6_9FIRM|nr:2-hydroxymuconate tautomerase [Desulfuribacillus alkaliarsenatis]OEF98216.1 4-oxalocrotonate tautomerase [Desulfuribacillus alkaliarsenatis]
MPFVTVELLEGRTMEQKRALAEKVTEAVEQTTGAPKERIHVFVKDIKKDEYAPSGIFVCDK